MEDKLNFIYSSVSEWLRFAESKNNMLIGFDSAIIAGILAISTGSVKADPSTKVMLVIALILIGAGTVIAIISHLPRLRFIKFRLNEPNSQPASLMFFDHIHRKYTKFGMKAVLYCRKDSICSELKDAVLCYDWVFGSTGNFGGFRLLWNPGFGRKMFEFWYFSFRDLQGRYFHPKLCVNIVNCSVDIFWNFRDLKMIIGWDRAVWLIWHSHFR